MPSEPAPPSSRFSQAAQMRSLLHRYRTALLQRWWIPFLSLLLIGGPALVYAWLKPPTFESHAMMWMTGRIILPEGRMFSEELTSYMGTQSDLMKSGLVQARAYEKVRAEFPEIAPGNNASQGALPFALTVRTSPKSSILELRATGPSPEPTRAFLDSLMDAYVSFKRDARKQTSSGALSIITEQGREAEKQVKELQARMTAFQTSNNVSYLIEHGQSAGRHLAEIGALLSNLRTESRVLELLSPDQVAGLGAQDPVSSSGLRVPGQRTAQETLMQGNASSQQGYYQALQQLQLLKAKRDDLAHYLRPTHSKMIKLNQDIDGLEKMLKVLKEEGQQQALAQLANRKQAIDLQIQNLEAQYRAWETNATEANRKLAEFDQMKQEMQRAQALYDRMLDLVQRMDLNKNLEQEPLEPLGAASPARRTSANSKIAAVGLFVALMVGAGLLFLVEVMDEQFTSVDELSLQMPEEVIGQIPESSLPWRNRKGRILWPKRPEEQQAFAESFRNLRSSLLFMFEQSSRPRIILVTSAIPNEGKTTVATHFAASLAVAGSRVLLIDADLRRSSLHSIFSVRRSPGLREVLAGMVAPAEAIVPVVLEPPSGERQRTGEPRASAPPGHASPSSFQAQLFLMPAGSSGGSGSEVFLCGAVGPLLQSLSQQFDCVVIDSAPVLATDDATSLGPKTDGAFVVVRGSHTSSRMAREALDRLRRRHVRVLGLIYNRAAPSSDYYYRYSGQYRNGAEVPVLVPQEKS